MSADMNQRKARRFVSFAHVMVQGTGLYGYVTNVSETGIKILVNAETVVLDRDSPYQLEIHAPEAEIPYFICNAKKKWIRQIDMYHYEAGFELSDFPSPASRELYVRLIENYAGAQDSSSPLQF